MSESLHVVQLTDTHLFADPESRLMGLRTADALRGVLAAVAQLPVRPDLFLLTGDLSQDESLASYQNLQDWLLPFAVPCYWLLGNHDNLANLEAALTDPFCSTRQSFQAQGWQFLCLNSQQPGKVYGQLGPETLIWLELELQQHPQTPTLIALHHPPFPIQSGWMDAIGLRQSEALWAILDRHPQVKLVLCGHVHQESSYQRQGVLYLSAPSTCVQFEPYSSEFKIDPIAPGFRSLKLYPDGRFETEVIRADFSISDLNLAALGY